MMGFHALGQQALGALATTDRTVSASVGTFTLTGQSVGLLFHRRLTASVGTFTVSGVTADSIRSTKRLRISSGGGSRGLLASAGGGGKGLRIRA